MKKRPDEAVTLNAEIDPRVLGYQMMLGILWHIVTVVGIPFIPISLIVFLLWYKPRYMAHHSLKLTETGVEIRRGVIFQSQTQFSLDRVTDVSVAQGPLMRRYGVYGVTVETAGQTVAQGTAAMVGVVDPYDFRDAVMHNAEIYKRSQSVSTPGSSGPSPSDSSGGQIELLTEIRDILSRIERKG